MQDIRQYYPETFRSQMIPLGHALAQSASLVLSTWVALKLFPSSDVNYLKVSGGSALHDKSMQPNNSRTSTQYHITKPRHVRKKRIYRKYKKNAHAKNF